MEMGFCWRRSIDTVTVGTAGGVVVCEKSTLSIIIIHAIVYGVWAVLETTIHIVSCFRKEEHDYSIFLGLFYMLIKMSMICGFFIFSCYLGDSRVEKLGFVFFLPIIYTMFHKLSVQIRKNTVKVEEDPTYEIFLKEVISKFVNKDK